MVFEVLRTVEVRLPKAGRGQMTKGLACPARRVGLYSVCDENC